MELKRRIVSIDSSTTVTGIAVWEEDRLIHSETVDFEKIKPMEKRFPLMSLMLLHIIQEHMPDAVYIEECVVTRNAQAQRFLVRLQGVIYGWCLQHNCTFEAIRPSAWRKQLGFHQGPKVKREELKAQAIAHIQEKYMREFPEDECEAICIGEAALIMEQEKKENCQ